MLTLGSTLAIFLMLGISSFGLFLAKKINIPHSVLLVLIGIGFGFMAYVPNFSFLGEFELTPELLFYLLLPTLIFESAYHMNARRLIADGTIVFALSIGSFLISTAIITFLLHFLLLFIGLSVPFSITLLFGALISATDPVAVLALFKEYGVPKRLSLIFEGESLFNDATAVALFIITLEAISHGGFTIFSSFSGLLTFISMLVLGVLFGLLVGGIFAYLVGTARESEVASIALTVILAHITFILAEVISNTTFPGGFSLHISPIISTTVASLLMGNYGKARINPRAESFISTIWELFAFMANSLIFILIGILMVKTPLGEPVILLAIFISIITVALARAVSIYSIVGVYNQTQNQIKKIPLAWQHLMAWGSLRGALAITMVFLIPDTFSVPGWNLDVSPKEFLMAITIGCIGATLFIKATTIRHLVNRFKLDDLTEVEEIEYQEARALIHYHVTEQLVKYQERGYIDTTIAEHLLNDHEKAYSEACDKINRLSAERRDDLAFRVLRIYAIGIEKRHLKVLYDHHEITESVFRRIQGKLKLQLEAIEDGDCAPDVTIHADNRDIFDHLFQLFYALRNRFKPQPTFPSKYMYYRAQAIISRKVLKELGLLEKVSTKIFTPEAVQHVKQLYQSFKQNSEKKLADLALDNPEEAVKLASKLAEWSVKTIEENVLTDIFEKELITQKLYITLRNQSSLSDH
jgi:monovalent cation:H+ antiporter, CPA1 family